MGIMQIWKGKVFANSFGAKNFVDPATGVSGKLQGAVKGVIQAVAQANTDFTFALPPGASFMAAKFICTTAFTGNTATLQIGSTAGGAEYVAATDIKTPAATATILVLKGIANTISLPALDVNGKNIYVRLVQTATFTAVGTGTLFLEFA